MTSKKKVFSSEELDHITATQKGILELINDTFDDVDNFECINFVLAAVHASKLRDYASKSKLRVGFEKAILAQHVVNVITLYEKGDFQYTDTRKK